MDSEVVASCAEPDAEFASEAAVLAALVGLDSEQDATFLLGVHGCVETAADHVSEDSACVIHRASCVVPSPQESPSTSGPPENSTRHDEALGNPPTCQTSGAYGAAPVRLHSCPVENEAMPNSIQRLAFSKAMAGWPGCPPEEELRELRRLSQCQLRALTAIRMECKKRHQQAYPLLVERCEKLGLGGASSIDETLAWVREEAPIIIHVNLSPGGKLDQLLKDTHYRNLFETGTSGGSRDHSSRKKWESNLFEGSYDRASAFQRPKYGVLNITNDPTGLRACSNYGTSHLVLRGVRLRTTLAPADSAGLTSKQLATPDFYAHVLMEFSNAELEAAIHVGTQHNPGCGFDNSVIGCYKEAQIHGEVCLARNIAYIVPDADLSPEHLLKVQELADHCNAKMLLVDIVGEGISPQRKKKVGKGTRVDTAGTAAAKRTAKKPPKTDYAASGKSAGAGTDADDEALMQALEASRLLAENEASYQAVIEASRTLAMSPGTETSATGTPETAAGHTIEPSVEEPAVDIDALGDLLLMGFDEGAARTALAATGGCDVAAAAAALV